MGARTPDWAAQALAIGKGSASVPAPAAPASPQSALPDWAQQVNALKGSDSASGANTGARPHPWTWRSAIFGHADAALGVGSGMLAQPIAGLAGLVDAAARRFNPSLPSAAHVVNSFENDLTYRPRTQEGQLLTQAASYPFRKLAQGADWAGQKVATATGSPALGAATNTAIQALPLAIGAKVPPFGDAIDAVPREAPPAVAEARALSLKLTPTEAQMPGGVLGRSLESLTNHAKLERTISRANAPRVTALAARDVGIHGAVTPASISEAYEPHYAVYDELKQLGTIPTDEEYARTLAAQRAPGADSFPNAKKPDVEALRDAYAVPQFEAKDALAQIRELRKEGNAEAFGKYDPSKNALGHAKLNIARALEDQIDRHLKGLAQGKPNREGFLHDFEHMAPEGHINGTGVVVGEDPQDPTAVDVQYIGRGANGNFGLRKLLALADKHSVPLTANVSAMSEHGIPTAELMKHYEAAGFRPDPAYAQYGAEFMRREPNATSAARRDWAKQSSDLVSRFRDARKGIAKLVDFEKAWHAGNEENVSARTLGKKLQKGAPLSGDMRRIAETANKFPRAFQDTSKLRNTGPLSNLDFKLEGGLSAVKPLAAIKAAPFFLAAPAVRAILSSDLYQRAAFGPFDAPRTPSFPALLRSGRALPLLSAGQQVPQLPLSQILGGALVRR